MGLKPDEFWRMTFREVEQACKGYEVRLARSRELERYIAAILINANLKKGRKQVRPEDIMSLVTDKRAKAVGSEMLMSAEEFEDFKRLMDKVEWQTPN